MRTITPDQLTLAVLVAAIAGMVDVVAFLTLGGFFASFMSGNSTRLAISVTANWFDLQLAAALIITFVAGVVIAALLRRRHPARGQAVVLTLVAGLLTIASAFAGFGDTWPLLLLAMAMGAVNLLFEADGAARIGLTYMSGTLVRLGIALADWYGGRSVGNDWQRPLLLWTAFFGGGMIGVGLYARFGLPTLWLPTLITIVLAVLNWRTTTPKQEDSAEQH
jgi:uncharacterized membrane protein YoaK (UPF0700 family)